MKGIPHVTSPAQRRLRLLGSAAAGVFLLAGCGGGTSDAGAPPCPSCGGSFTSGASPVSIAVADVNGDGVPDLLVAMEFPVGSGGDGESLYPAFANVFPGARTPAGSFDPPVQYYTGYSNPTSIAAADLTGSGHIDFVVSDSQSGSVDVFLHGATTGTFQSAINVVSGGTPNQVVAGDLTGSGSDRDLAIADDSPNGRVIVLLHDPANPGQFLAPIELTAGNYTTSVAIGSLGNGVTAIVAAASDISGDHGFVDAFIETSTAPVAFAPAVSFPAGSQPVKVRIADVNGDGFPDLVVANNAPGADGSGTPGVSVLLQDAAHPGSFLAPVTYVTSAGVLDVAVGDLDGDGRPDLVAALGYDPLSLSGAVAVLLQKPSPAAPGTFGPPVTYLGIAAPQGVAIADLNGDGYPDIAAADGTGATVMLQNTAMPGTFENPVQVGN